MSFSKMFSKKNTLSPEEQTNRDRVKILYEMRDAVESARPSRVWGKNDRGDNYEHPLLEVERLFIAAKILEREKALSITDGLGSTKDGVEKKQLSENIYKNAKKDAERIESPFPFSDATEFLRARMHYEGGEGHQVEVVVRSFENAINEQLDQKLGKAPSK